MSKLKIIAAILFVVAATSCQKNRTVPEIEDPNLLAAAPEWLLNEDLPVPIEFGVDAIVDTKADNTIEESGQFHDDNFRYGVVALDQYGKPHQSVTGISAKNTPTSLLVDGAEGLWKTEFTDGTHYYPMVSDKDYSFYAYRTDNTNTGFELSEDNKKNDINVGAIDVIWASAVAVPIGVLSGFNANYIRSLMDIENYSYFYLTSQNAPKFQFEHLMSRFIFVIKAENEYAEETMNGKVSIEKITIKGINKTCSLDVPTGVLTPTGADADSLNVNRDDSSVFYPVATGAQWGDPLFILPDSVDTYAATNGITMHMDINTPEGVFKYVKELRTTDPAEGFKAGKSYRFTIILKSYEKIEIVTDLSDWQEGAATEDFIIG